MALIDVVKYNGGPDVFAWKYPSEELGTWTQLIVNESQEAILVKEGRAVALFGRGRHTLDTKNIPLLRNIISIPFGGRSPYTAEVWYINKAQNLDVRWGTPSPVQIQDPKYGVFVPVGSNGTFGIRIIDSWKFLTKLVGTVPTFDKATVSDYFRGLYVAQVKDIISSYFLQKQVSVLEINAYMNELSQHMREPIVPVMLDYGVELVSFYVNDISVPEDDTAIKQLKDALAKRAEMNILGYDYQQGRSFDVLEGLAKNPGSATSAILGIGTGLGVGGLVGSAFNNMAQQIQTQNSTDESIRCLSCGKSILKGSKFCPECGKPLTKLCPKCNAVVSLISKFCPDCGEQF